MTQNEPLPTEMDVAVLSAPHDLRISTRAVPRPGLGEVLLEVGVVGICGSDLHFWHEGRSGTSTVDGPFVMGHEFGGRIRAVGPQVSADRVGERVAVEPGVPCGSCEACLGDLYNHCPHLRFYGAAPTDGAMQRYICVAADHAFVIPDSISDEAAALLEPLSVALWAAGRAGVTAGDSVLVIGAGPVGLLVADVVGLSDPGRLSIVDTNEHRLAVAAERTGADTFSPAQWVEQPQGTNDVVIECSGAQSATEVAAAAVRRSGRIVVVGVGPLQLSIPMALIQEGEVSVTGSHRYRHTWPHAIELAASGRVDLDSLVTSRFDLDHVVEALENTARDAFALKTVVQVGGSADL